MKRHAALVVLMLLPIVSDPARAEPPGSARKPPGGPPGAGPGERGGPGGRRDPFKEMFGRPGPSASAPHPHHSGGPPGMGHGRGPFHRGQMHALIKSLRSGEITKADFEAKLKELKTNAKERRKARHDELRGRFTKEALRGDAFRAEFKTHARRMAFLNRAQVVAQTELTGDKQKKALARIDKLLELESKRHDEKLEKLKYGDTAPPGSALAAASAAAPAASAAVEKKVAP
jgi:hypothetical protein